MSRLIVLVSFLFCMAEAVAQESMGKEQIEKWSQYYQQLAKGYELRVLDDSGEEKLKLAATPALRWHNPIRATTHGECFLWTKDGRVHAIASLFSYSNQGGRRVAHAFNAFGGQVLVAERDGQEFWRVAENDLPKMKPVPGSPTVAVTAPLRMAQMRNIARRFTASSGGTDSEEPRELRLLTSPLYRYSQSDTNKVDGTLFSFAMGTDPEVLLLLESFQEGSKSEWRFAAARHTTTSLYVSYEGTEVWSYLRGTPAPAYLSQHGIDRKPALLP